MAAGEQQDAADEPRLEWRLAADLGVGRTRARMTFDLNASITTIGYGEPTLWAAVAAATFIAIVLGRLMGAAFGSIGDRWRRRVYGLPASGAVALLVVVLTALMLSWLFSHYYGGMVCTVFVTPALFLPAAVGIIVESVAWRRARRTQIA